MERLSLTVFTVIVAVIYIPTKSKEQDIGVRDNEQQGIVNSGPENLDLKSRSHLENKAIVEFSATIYVALECEGKAKIELKRFGNTDIPCYLHIETLQGTANEDDFVSLKENITLAKHEVQRKVDIYIKDDNDRESYEYFYVKVSVYDNGGDVAVGNIPQCEVLIIKDVDFDASFHLGPGTYMPIG